MTELHCLFEHFTGTLSIEWKLPDDLKRAAQAFIDGCSSSTMIDEASRTKSLFTLVSSKLGLNKRRVQEFIDRAARHRVFFNYHEKLEVLACFDRHDKAQFESLLSRKKTEKFLCPAFDPFTPTEILAALHEQLRLGKVSRRDAKECEPSERKEELLRAIFGSYVSQIFPENALHKYFNPDCRKEYFPDFYQHLLHFQPKTLHRDCALIFLCIDESIRRGRSRTELRDTLYSFISESYKRLANHCFLGILIRPFKEGNEDGQWSLFSDLILYAEKHIESQLKAGYFKPNEIQKATSDYVPCIDLIASRFDVENGGLFFRDCFVLDRASREVQIETTTDPVDLLLLFDKNEKDETVIPCPACRSTSIAGNSYPALGVKSWECQNPICPERSAFDRGNRYSLASLIKQEAIKSESDQIPEWSLKRWKLDVVPVGDDSEVMDMLLRHFSLHGDSVRFVNVQRNDNDNLGRNIIYESYPERISVDGTYKRFQDSAYFKRFAINRHTSPTPVFAKIISEINGVEILQGDCFDVLSCLEHDSVDGAVTSPPYYNARSYSVWANIYCYLYDMYNSARQVFRVLKPGAVYLFNIFDYFDNENNVVLSAMGKKRMILGAYIINLFRRAGFELLSNVVWYKGEIEGKRNFNQGNQSPYYQFPFNCWEHIFVFRKPGGFYQRYEFPTILAAKPVVKMVKGKNILGHSAPFPAAVPNLLISQMEDGEVVLDPFAGSMTTGRLANRSGIRSISIELHREYCELGARLFRGEIGSLFENDSDQKPAHLFGRDNGEFPAA